MDLRSSVKEDQQRNCLELLLEYAGFAHLPTIWLRPRLAMESLVDPTLPAKKLRELFYSAHYIYDHIAHFFYLSALDFVVGPDADPAKRNVLGLIEKVGMESGG